MIVQQTKKQWMALLLAVGAIALCAPKGQATLSIINGDFQNNAPAGNVMNVDSWFDADSNAQSDGSWWLSTWYGPTVSANGTSQAGLSAQGGDSWLYQSLGTNDAPETSLTIKYDVGSFTDAGANRDLTYNFSIYSVDGTYTSAVQNVDIMGATGATLVAQTNVTFLNVAPGGTVTDNTATFDISGTAGQELYLRISNNGGLQWEGIDNISFISSLPPFHDIVVSPADGATGVDNTPTLSATIVDWGDTFMSASMELDGAPVTLSGSYSPGSGTNVVYYDAPYMADLTTHTGKVVAVGSTGSKTNEWTFTIRDTSLHLVNGDFEATHGADIADVTDWYDDNSGGFWTGAWQTDGGASPNGSSVVLFSDDVLAAAGKPTADVNDGCYLYQYIGSSVGTNTLTLTFDWGAPADDPGGRDLGMTVGVYAYDGVSGFTPAATNDVRGGAGVTLLDSASYEIIGTAGGAQVTNVVVSLNISGAGAQDLYLRFNNYAPSTSACWPILDNVILEQDFPPFHGITISPEDGATGVANPLTVTAEFTEWGGTYVSSSMEFDGNPVSLTTSNTVGDTTTITYDAGTLPVGSSHTVKVVAVGTTGSMTNQSTFIMGGGLFIANGDFETGAAASKDDVTGWYDPSNGTFWQGTWQDNNTAVSPNDTAVAVMGSYESGAIQTNMSSDVNEGNYLYQLIGTAEGASSLDFNFDWGAPDDDPGGRELGLTVGVYAYDGSGGFTPDNNTDVRGASGVTLLDSQSLTMSSTGVDGLISNVVVSLDLTGAGTQQLFLRFNSYRPANTESWVAVDNVALGLPVFVAPNIQSISVGGGMATLIWDSEVGKHYNILTRPSLTGGTWTTNTSGIASGGSTTSTNVSAAASTAFFKVEAY